MANQAFIIPPVMKYKSIRSEFKVERHRQPEAVAFDKRNNALPPPD